MQMSGGNALQAEREASGKGPEIGMCVVCLRNTPHTGDLSVARIELLRGNVAGVEVTKGLIGTCYFCHECSS